MKRAIRIGLFIGTLIGMSACAGLHTGPDGQGPYGAVEIGRAR